jgi:glycosyltransferase involved in cell wall biosynthesis
LAEISVMVPSFNYGHFLPEALDSLLSCDAPGFAEILVVDDASTDDTAEVAQSYGRVSYARNATRRGIVHNLNTYLPTLASDWVAMVSADDMVLPRFAVAHARVIAEHGHDPRLAIVYSGAKYTVTHQPTDRPELDGLVVGLDAWDANRLRGGNFVHGSAVLRKSAIVEVGGFPDVPIQEDHAMWLRMADAGFYGIGVGEVCLMYRMHADGSRDAGTDSKRAAPGWRHEARA